MKILPEVEKALRDAFVDYGVDMSQYTLVEDQLEGREIKIPDEPEDGEDEALKRFRGKAMEVWSVIFDHVSKPLALAIEWSSIKDEPAVFVGTMSFLSKQEEIEVKNG